MKKHCYFYVAKFDGNYVLSGVVLGKNPIDGWNMARRDAEVEAKARDLDYVGFEILDFKKVE